MPEFAIKFGPDDSLIGVVTAPDGPAHRGVALLMLNAGVIHRIGPHRINVKMARHAAALLGMASLRIDLSGLGDSPSSRSPLDYTKQATADISSAIDALETHFGPTKVIIFGICSGAVNGYSAALVDERICGLIMLDAFVFRTRAERWKQQVKRLSRLPGNPALLERALSAAKRRLLSPKAHPGFFETTDADVTAEGFAAGLRRLIRRGVRLFVVYSGTVQPADSNRGILSALGPLRFEPAVHYEFKPDIDHTLTALAAQRSLIDSIDRWLRSTSL